MIKRKKMTILIISRKKGSAQPLINAIKSHEVIHFEHSELTSSLISNLGIIDVVIDVNDSRNQKDHNLLGLFHNSKYIKFSTKKADDIEKWINLGVNRVIIGTSAILNNNLVEEAVKCFPKKIAVGLDLLGDFVAIKGWTEVFKKKSANYAY